MSKTMEYRRYSDLCELKHFMKHVSAITGEKLHYKADIAAELAWRDELIDDQRIEIQKLKQKINKLQQVRK